MKINNFHIQITTDNPDRLKAFYRDTVGLPPVPEMEDGAFAVGGANLFVDGHSETSGSSKEPHRLLIDLVVDDVVAERERLEAMGVNPYSAPGVVPFLLGIVISVLALVLLVRSVRAGGLALLRPGALSLPAGAGDGARRFVLTAALTLGYAMVLVGRLPFWAATAIFVAAFVLAFEWRPGLGGARLARRAAAIAAFALAVGVSVSVLFEDIFLVRLP